MFHLLWNNKLEYFDRTLLLAFYKLLGKRLVFTVHNVNVRQRDGNDSVLNRLTLRCQYRLVDHLFVHTQRMSDELQAEFGVPPSKDQRHPVRHQQHGAGHGADRLPRRARSSA